MTRSVAARTALLDVAERLFAEHGISVVSDRRIAEEAGQKNHSAVRYHFGGREGLLRTLVERQATAVAAQRLSLMEQSESLVGDVRALVLPVTANLAELPSPSWRARFVARAFYHPETAPLFRDSSRTSVADRSIGVSLLARMSTLDPGVARGRLSLMMRLVLTSCADVEGAADRDGADPRWDEVGQFLVDALAGMLTGPSTQASRYPDVDWASTQWSEVHRTTSG